MRKLSLHVCFSKNWIMTDVRSHGWSKKINKIFALELFYNASNTALEWQNVDMYHNWNGGEFSSITLALHVMRASDEKKIYFSIFRMKCAHNGEFFYISRSLSLTHSPDTQWKGCKDTLFCDLWIFFCRSLALLHTFFCLHLTLAIVFHRHISTIVLDFDMVKQREQLHNGEMINFKVRAHKWDCLWMHAHVTICLMRLPQTVDRSIRAIISKIAFSHDIWGRKSIP